MKILKFPQLINGVTAVLLIVIMSGQGSPTAMAAGTASFSLSPSSGSYTVGNSFNLTVYETSQASDNVEGVQANLSYNASYLQCNTVSESGTVFTYLGQSVCDGGSIKVGEAAASPVSGQQFVAVINFTVISAGSSSVGISTGSDIQNNASGSVWNGASPSASLSLSNPVSTSSGGTTPGPTTPSPKTSTTTSHSTSAGSTTTPTLSTQSTPTPTPVTQTITPTTAPTSLGSLSLTVLDAKGKPVAKASVSVDNKPAAETDGAGLVHFTGLKSGSHSITVVASGEKTYTNAINLQSGENKVVSIKLVDAPSSVKIAVVSLIAAGMIALAILALSLIRRKSVKPVGLVGGNLPPPPPPSGPTIITPTNSNDGS